MTEEIKTGEEVSGEAGQSEEDLKKEEEDKKVVPVSAIKGIRDELKEVKNVNQNLADQVELYKANMNQNPQPKKEESEFDKIEDDDLLTFNQVKTMIRNIEGKYNAEIQKLGLGQKDNNYEDVIKTYLPKIIKDDPELTETIRTSNNPLKLAYKLACLNPEFKKEGKTKTESTVVEDEVDKIIANAKKPGSVSNASGGASSGLGAAAKFEQMSDEEIMKRVAEIKRKG